LDATPNVNKNLFVEHSNIQLYKLLVCTFFMWLHRQLKGKFNVSSMLEVWAFLFSLEENWRVQMGYECSMQEKSRRPTKLCSEIGMESGDM